MDMQTVNQSGGYVGISAVLVGMGEAPPAPGLRGRLYAAIDTMRADAAPATLMAIAEGISLAALQLDWAVLKGDAAKRQAMRDRLAELGEAWNAVARAEPVELELSEAAGDGQEFENDFSWLAH